MKQNQSLIGQLFNKESKLKKSEDSVILRKKQISTRDQDIKRLRTELARVFQKVEDLDLEREEPKKEHKEKDKI